MFAARVCQRGNFYHLHSFFVGAIIGTAAAALFMPTPKFPNDLRTHRLCSGLSQIELASLLDISHSTVSRYECGLRPIPITHLLAFEIIFGISASDILVPFRDRVEDAIGRRALKLHNLFQRHKGLGATKKLRFLETLTDRIHEVRLDA